MKRMITLLMVLAMLVACLTTTAFAAKPGETVDVAITVSGNPGFGGYTVNLNYDKTALKLESMSDTGCLTQGKGTFLPNATESCASFFISSLNNVTGDGTLFIAKFTILDGAKAGESYKVTASFEEIGDANGENVSMSISGGTVKIDECSHAWGAWTETKAPTCAAEGEETRTCTLCGKSETKAVAKVDHVWGEWEETKAPTCAAEGEETRVCTVCKATETNTLEKVDHTWGEWTETKAPTCEAEGEETRVCTVCQKTETRAVEKVAHAWGEWTETKAPTCTAKGEETRTCSACEATETREIKALGHSYENNGKCEHCGADKPASGGNKPSGGDKDKVPATGDITPVITMGVVAMVCVIAAVAYVTKRRITK